MSTISHDTYEILLNLIGFWLLDNHKVFKTRDVYEYQGRIADRKAVESALTYRRKTASSDGLTGRYVEAAIVDNTDWSFMPNYVTYQNTKYMKANVINMIQRVLQYESVHGRIPLTVGTEISTSGSSTSNSLNPYLASKGCSGMGQCTGYYCACNSLQQAFYRLTGKLISESTIASVAGTTTAGTGHSGIETAVAWFNKKYGYNLKISWKNFSELGSSQSARFTKLQELVDKGAVFFHLLYRSKYGHYEVPYRVNGSNIVVLNSLGDSCGNGTYCGYLETRSQSLQQSYINGISQKSVCIITK
ncbi:MAG: hypothetical protein IJ743_00595 [Bacilli bacterium]|nr:hypothetical protein [Methanobrevibacter sp.]MBR1748274.1 hypothetical protein [Bacilli bacterium]